VWIFDVAGSINFIFGINLNFCINWGDISVRISDNFFTNSRWSENYKRIMNYHWCSWGCSQQNNRCEKVSYTSVSFSKSTQINTENKNYELTLVRPRLKSTAKRAKPALQNWKVRLYLVLRRPGSFQIMESLEQMRFTWRRRKTASRKKMFYFLGRKPVSE